MTKFNSETREILDSVKERMDKFLNHHYHVNENPIVLKTLEQEYEDILATNGDYEYVSAVGYRAILKNGDTVKATVNSGNSGHFFLNGERMTADYTYTGDGCEMVSVWVFETVGSAIVIPPTLNDTPSFTPYEINIKNIAQVPVIATQYYAYSSTIKTYNFVLSSAPSGVKVLIANGQTDFRQKLSGVEREIYSDCSSLNSNNTVLRGLSKLVKFSAPNLTNIWGYGDSLSGLTSIETWDFEKLRSIENSHGSAYLISGKTMVIPETVKTLKGRIVGSVTTLILKCNDANSIDNIWCGTAPTNFSMVKDWKSSINIAVAAKNWGKEKFIDLFENYLVDLSVVGDDGSIYAEREITIPQAIYDVLTDEEFAIAETKGWIVGGA